MFRPGSSWIVLVLALSSMALSSDSSPADDREDRPSPKPLPKAHAHNDYRHERPLLDALDNGFCSVEADVYVVDGKLLVAHDRKDLRPERTLEKLYLDPLLKRVKLRGGRVYEKGPGFTLLIDFKSEGKSTYAVLRKELEVYRQMLTKFDGDKISKGAVTVVISGNRPWKTVAADSPRYAGVDGRLSDLSSKKSASIMPMVSDNWRNHFTWRGKGKMPDEERKKLRKIARRSREMGWALRFWATPESEALWKELSDAGVDHINTDQLERLRKFLLRREPPKKRSRF